jgi:hypothetical protein
MMWASRFCRFTLKETALCIRCAAGWLGLKANIDSRENIEPRFLGNQNRSLVAIPAEIDGIGETSILLIP